jgi:hypothetical protein
LVGSSINVAGERCRPAQAQLSLPSHRTQNRIYEVNAMASSASPTAAPVGASISLNAQTPVWSHLKQAIAKSSGFQRWQIERQDIETESNSLDTQVSKYLRETLETLAY